MVLYSPFSSLPSRLQENQMYCAERTKRPYNTNEYKCIFTSNMMRFYIIWVYSMGIRWLLTSYYMLHTGLPMFMTTVLRRFRMCTWFERQNDTNHALDFSMVILSLCYTLSSQRCIILLHINILVTTPPPHTHTHTPPPPSNRCRV